MPPSELTLGTSVVVIGADDALDGVPGTIVERRPKEAMYVIDFDDKSSLEAHVSQILPLFKKEDLETQIDTFIAHGLFHKGYQDGVKQGYSAGRSTLSRMWFLIILMLTNISTGMSVMAFLTRFNP